MKFLSLEYAESDEEFDTATVPMGSFYIYDTLANAYVVTLDSLGKDMFGYSLHDPSFDIDITLNLNFRDVAENNYPIFSCFYVDKSLSATENVNLVAVGGSFLIYLDSVYSSSTGGDTGGTSDPIDGFSIPDLNGNCGSFPNGTIVNVVGFEDQFIVAGSQFCFNDPTARNSMLVYKLLKDENFVLVPDVLVSLYVAPVVESN